MNPNRSAILAALSAVLLLSALLLSSCGGGGLRYREGSPGSLAGRVEHFVEAVEARQAELCDEEWAQAAAAFDAYAEETEAVFGQLDDEQKRRIARVAGEWAGIQTRRAAAGVESLLEDAEKMLPAFLDGLTATD